MADTAAAPVAEQEQEEKKTPEQEKLEKERGEFEKTALRAGLAYMSGGMLWFYGNSVEMFSAWLAARGLTVDGEPLPPEEPQQVPEEPPAPEQTASTPIEEPVPTARSTKK